MPLWTTFSLRSSSLCHHQKLKIMVKQNSLIKCIVDFFFIKPCHQSYVVRMKSGLYTYQIYTYSNFKMKLENMVTFCPVVSKVLLHVRLNNLQMLLLINNRLSLLIYRNQKAKVINGSERHIWGKHSFWSDEVYLDWCMSVKARMMF